MKNIKIAYHVFICMPKCERCDIELPQVARYCYLCGEPLKGISVKMQDVIAHKSIIKQTTVGSINITNEDHECPNCGNPVNKHNPLLKCSRCKRIFCFTCEQWFREIERMKGENPHCEDCYQAEKTLGHMMDMETWIKENDEETTPAEKPWMDDSTLVSLIGGKAEKSGNQDYNCWISSGGIEFNYVEAGEFVMGSAEVEKAPPHLVRITKGYYISRYPITQRQWSMVMRKNPSRFKGDDRPVERVSYKDVWKFLEKINIMDKENNYRLPTEAEWEFACRGGTRSRYWYGDTTSVLGTYAWYRDNSRRQTHPVGCLPANPFGLYDMLGNVWEWCYDRYGRYPRETLEDPVGPRSGRDRVIRGGSWYSKPRSLLCAYRHSFEPSYREDNLGFRIVLFQ